MYDISFNDHLFVKIVNHDYLRHKTNDNPECKVAK